MNQNHLVFLNLCEVKRAIPFIQSAQLAVFVTGVTNIAIGKPVIQSSTFMDLYYFMAHSAVDGNFQSMTESAPTDEPKWWRLDLKEVVTIDTIVLWNRVGEPYNDFVDSKELRSFPQ